MSWGGFLGAIGGSAINANAVSGSNMAARKMAREQMRFQRDMSNTAHQRAVRDLKEAGLNPQLAAGNPASSPSGASADVDAPQIDMPAIMSAFSQQMEQDRVDLDKARLGIEQAKSAAEIAKTISETDLTKMKTRLSQKGMIRADMEGEASKVINQMLEWIQKKWNFNQPPKFEGDFRRRKP